ncbi:MAG: HepT-like ribonuclease domain-containing protein [bacterium]
MSKFDPAVTLPQTIDFITEAQTLVVGISLEQLLADPIKLRAFERVMELVGESVKRVPQDFRDTHSQIPWEKITGMRDVICHAYEDLAYEVLWDAVEMHFPKLLKDLKQILSDL